MRIPATVNMLTVTHTDRPASEHQKSHKKELS